jgi:DNA helicase II / ATP-dependent DNA helicase PcrA
LKEIISAMAEFDTLPAFLEHVSLVMEKTDQAGEEQVSIMTLHGAKGLEFDHVFLPGWEEEIFPSRRSLEENGNAGLEEERRLAYVGITRARQRALITFVANRNMYGSWINAIPSRFIAELPKEHVQMFALSGNAAYGGGMGERYQKRERSAPLWQQMRLPQAGKNFAKPSRPAPREIMADYDIVQEDADDEALRPGSRVFHQKFGYGTVQRLDHGKLEINFDHGGVKKVLAEFVTMAGKV